jgi:PAS domain S-box-containing protein
MTRAHRNNSQTATLRATLRRVAHAYARALHRLTTFLEVTGRIEEEENLQTQLELIADAVVKARMFRRALITLLDPDWMPICIGAAGIGDDELKKLRSKPPLSPGLRKRIFQDQFRISNSYYVPHTDLLARQLSEAGIKSTHRPEEFEGWHPEDLLFVPMYNRQGNVIGTLSVDDPFDGKRPTIRTVRILELFAREAAYIIELKQLEKELRTTKEYLERLFDSTPDIIVTTDGEGKVQLFNPGAEEITGYRAEEILGKPVESLFESRDEAKAVTHQMREGKGDRKGTLRNYETKLRAKSGELIPISLTANIIYDEKGAEAGTEGISKDLRQLKKLQDELVKAERDRERRATLARTAAAVSDELNNRLAVILANVQMLDLRLSTAEPELGGRQRTEMLGKLSLIQSETSSIADTVRRLRELAERGFKLTPYVGDIEMVDLRAAGPPETRRRILVADDKEAFRETVADYLRSRGMEVELASDGEEVLQKVAENHFDLVVSDIRMPRRNGYEVLNGVRRLSPNTKVVLMTAFGYDPDHVLVRSAREGLSNVLFKPFRMEELYDAITAALAAPAGPL